MTYSLTPLRYTEDRVFVSLSLVFVTWCQGSVRTFRLSFNDVIYDKRGEI